jgi:hypothetical protein
LAYNYRMLCPNCGFDSPNDMFFCGSCGTHIARECHVCQSVMPLVFQFCGKCGTRLEKEHFDLLSSKVTAHHSALETNAERSRLITTEETLSRSSAAPPLSGQRRLATIVIADVQDSTLLMEQLGTEDWVEVMNKTLQLMASEIYRFGGEVDQFRGDGLVAFFGAWSAHEDDPKRAVLSALMMQLAIPRSSAELAKCEGIEHLDSMVSATLQVEKGD